MEVVTVRVEWAVDDGTGPVARERRVVLTGGADVMPWRLKEMVESVRCELGETEPRFKV